jgi:PAS domain S-box-containing protein
MKKGKTQSPSKKNPPGRKPDRRSRARKAGTVSSEAAVKDAFTRKAGTRQGTLEIQNEALRAKQPVLEKYQVPVQVSDIAPHGYFTFDGKGIIRDVNLAGSRLLGTEKQVLTNTSFSRYLHSGDQKRFRAHLITALESGKTRTAEFRIRRKDDTLFSAELQSTPLNGSGKADLCLTIMIDVTERRNLEQLLMESEERYRTLADSSPEAIVVQQEGKCIYLNRAGLGLFGAKTRGEIIGKNIFESVGPASGQLQEQELKFRRLDGSALEVEAVSTPILFGGKPADQIVIKDISARVMTEKALRFQAGVLTQVKDAVIAIDNDQRITYWNPGAEKLFQYGAAEALGRRLDEISSYRWDVRGSEETCRDALNRAGFWRGESVHTTRKGKELHVESSVSNLKDESGGDVGLLVVIHDITERKLLEKEIRESEEEFRSMFELSAIGKTQEDPSTGRFLRFNKKFCDITGYPAEELSQRSFIDITYPEDRARDLQAYQRGLKPESPGWTSEKRSVRKDGSLIWVKVTGTVIFDDAGKPLTTMAAVEDITERKAAEQTLRESEERYRSLVESSPEAICVQQEGACVYLNPAGLQLLGAKSVDEVKGKKVLDFVHPDFRGSAAERIRMVEEFGKRVPPREMKILRLNGAEVDVESSASPTVFDGRPAAQVIIKNITDRKNTELRLRLQATVLAQVSDAVIAVGRDGRIIFWNNGAERIYKLKAEEAIGKQRDEIYQYRWIPGVGRADGEAPAPVFLGGENVHVLKNGEEMYVESSVSVLLDWAGAPAGWLAVMRDVTERKGFEQKLRESEERYRSLVESAPDAIIVSQDGKVVYVNPATITLLGASDAGEIIGKCVTDLVHPDSLPLAEERLRRIEQEGTQESARALKVLKFDGSLMYVDAVGTPVTYRSKPAVQIIAKDITEGIKFEEALRNSERLYRLMFESNPQPMWIYDTDTLRFLYVNDAAVMHYGYTREEFLSMTVRDIRTAEGVDVLQDNSAKTASGLHGEGAWRHRKKDGTIIDVELISHGLTVDGKNGRVVLAHDITARLRAESDLHESQKAYRTLAENLPGIVYRAFSGDGRIQFFNRTASALTGYRDSELTGGSVCSLESLILPEDRHGVVEAVREAVHAKKPFTIEYRLRHRDGRVRFMLEQGAPIFANDGKLLYIDGVISDVTDRKDAERALRESEERQSAVFDHSPVAIFVKDLQGRYLLANRQTERWWGVTRQEILGKTDHEFLPGEAADRFRITDRHVAETGSVLECEETVLRPDGPHEHFLIKFPLFDTAGEIYAVCGISTDITDRKRAEGELKRARLELELRVRERTAELAATIEALQAEIAERRRMAAERDRLVAAVESTAEAVVVTDKRGIIQYVNPAFEHITGYAKQEAIGNDIHFLDSGQHAPDFFERMRETIHDRGVWKGRMTNRRKDGTIYYEDCTYSPVRDRSGNIAHYVSIKHDVTDKLRLEAIAETIDTMNNIGYVFSGVRHEIGNPVSSLLIIMSLLKKKYETGPKEAIREYVSQAIAQVERIEYLLTSLKNFNMYENLQISSISLSSFLEKFVPLISSDLEGKGIQLEVEAAAQESRISADPRALQQALLNVIVNASEALVGRPEPKIVLRSFRSGGMITIRVSDNGAGIPEDRMKDLFKPFYTTKSQGTGLGLVITRKLLSRMNGYIELESRKEEGTVVDIFLAEGTVEPSV